MLKYYIYTYNNCYYIKTKTKLLDEELTILYNLIDPDDRNNIIFTTNRIKRNNIDFTE